MLTILVGVTVFVVLVLLMVAVLMAAKARLVQSGDVMIVVNDDPTKTLRARAGATLLSTLAEQKIFVPSACGGKGSCGVCKVEVHAGGGTLLPTESGLVSRGEARNGVRLSCQVKVKQDMKIHLDDAIFGVRKWHCKVRSNNNVATFIKELVLELPAGEEVPFRAGGYIQIECPPHTVHYKDFDIGAEYREDWDAFKLWDVSSTTDQSIQRAYSMANFPLESDIIMLNVRVATPPLRTTGIPAGVMSSYIFSLKPGDDVVISGPYGEFFAKETRNEMCFIGGGAGMAPMRSHIFDQFRRVQTERRVTFWYGARSLKEAFYVEDFNAIQREHPNFSWHLALSEPKPEDQWTGAQGFIHNVLLNEYLRTHPAPEDIEYYLCGPPMMLKACMGMLESLGVERENIAFDDFG
ncbi:MAG: NADH:ubiquinone reductase (Na(+)-transporting) subunit F [Gemmatimonadaceae bacterium]|nr:NADH:ubiquinone reductase (Na(+)-transporting) subunit F [Gemmatimonadaceae bacterium]